MSEYSAWFECVNGCHGRYSLLDVLGQVVRQEGLTGSETFIEMNGLASGAYTLQLVADDKPIGTFRILKH